MAGSQFEDKDRFISFIKDVIRNRETGLVSILTESERSIVLKFSQGVLIHSYSRIRDIVEVIKLISESNRIKFDLTPIPAENGTEILPGTLLLELLETGVGLETETDLAHPPENSANSEFQAARGLLEDVAAEYMGMVAEVIVDEALDVSGSLEEAIDKIASSIPNPEQSASFRSTARKQIRQIAL